MFKSKCTTSWKWWKFNKCPALNKHASQVGTLSQGLKNLTSNYPWVLNWMNTIPSNLLWISKFVNKPTKWKQLKWLILKFTAFDHSISFSILVNGLLHTFFFFLFPVKILFPFLPLVSLAGCLGRVCLLPYSSNWISWGGLYSVLCWSHRSLLSWCCKKYLSLGFIYMDMGETPIAG